jgi:elongation factor Ts
MRSQGRQLCQLVKPSVRGFASPGLQLIKDLRAQTSAPIADCKKALQESDGDMDKAFQWLRERGSAKASDLGKRDALEGLVGIVSSDTDAAIVQVCCETDFSQRNEFFQSFVGNVARTTFSRVPPPPGPGVHNVSIDALSKQSLYEDESQGTVADGLADLVGKIRENIHIKQASKASVASGLVGAYVHGSIAGHPLIGTSAAIVSISSDKELSEDEKEQLRPAVRRLAMHVVAAKPAYLNEDTVPEEVLKQEKDTLAAQVAQSGKPPAIVEKIVQGRMKKYFAEMTLLNQPHMIEEDSPVVSKVIEQLGAQVGAQFNLEGFALYRTGR